MERGQIDGQANAPLSRGDDDLARRLLREHKERKAFAEERERQEAARYQGYLFWCSECKEFVGDRRHQCEQWTQITYIPPEAVAAIERRVSERTGRGR